MKKISLSILLFLLCVIFIYAESPDLKGINKDIFNSTNLFKPDSQAYSLSTGFLYNGISYQSYSLFNASYMNKLNKNFTLIYDLSYLNANFNQNYMIGGLGLSYGNDRFRFSLYMNRVFEANDYNIVH